MDFFLSIMDLMWDLFQRPFTLYGYTFSFQSIMFLIFATTILCIIIHSIFNN